MKPGDLELVSWPANNQIAGAFVKPEDLVGRSVLYPMDKDQPITDKFLAALGSGIGLAGKIPTGMRAIALRSDEVMGVAGFLFPGSHLDVLVTYRTENSPEPTTLTVLQDAEVLAAGQKIQPDPEGKPVTATVVTLLLTPEDAQRAVLASTQGAIHFVLRSGSDKVRVEEAPLALSQLSGGSIHALQAVSGPHLARVRGVVAERQLTVVASSWFNGRPSLAAASRAPEGATPAARDYSCQRAGASHVDLLPPSASTRPLLGPSCLAIKMHSVKAPGQLLWRREDHQNGKALTSWHTAVEAKVR